MDYRPAPLPHRIKTEDRTPSSCLVWKGGEKQPLVREGVSETAVIIVTPYRGVNFVNYSWGTAHLAHIWCELHAPGVNFVKYS
jgi:hypothetical protein